jgi:hypothetical protein
LGYDRVKLDPSVERVEHVGGVAVMVQVSVRT